MKRSVPAMLVVCGLWSAGLASSARADEVAGVVAISPDDDVLLVGDPAGDRFRLMRLVGAPAERLRAYEGYRAVVRGTVVPAGRSRGTLTVAEVLSPRPPELFQVQATLGAGGRVLLAGVAEEGVAAGGPGAEVLRALLEERAPRRGTFLLRGQLLQRGEAAEPRFQVQGVAVEVPNQLDTFGSAAEARAGVRPTPARTSGRAWALEALRPRSREPLVARALADMGREPLVITPTTVVRVRWREDSGHEAAWIRLERAVLPYAPSAGPPPPESAPSAEPAEGEGLSDVLEGLRRGALGR